MKIALLEISHWHFPLYIEDLLTSGVDIIALSDKNEKIRNQYGHKFNCSVYSDWRQLLMVPRLRIPQWYVYLQKMVVRH